MNTDSAMAAGLSSRRLLWFGIAAGVLIIAFFKPLEELIRYTSGSDMYSHVLLVPVVSAYLAWAQRKNLQVPRRLPKNLAGVFLLAGLVTLGIYLRWKAGGKNLAKEDYLAITSFSFVCFFVGICMLAAGKENLGKLAFPIGFLFLMVPFPTLLNKGLTVFLQYASAEASYLLLKMSGTPIFRNGLIFTMPGVVIEVAEQCSGVHSTLVLFITSLLGGHLFLRSTWRKAALASAVIPIGILRNGLRILAIGWMSVHVDRNMINGPLHKWGGPPFFLLSLVPLFALLWYFYRSERRKKQGSPPDGTQIPTAMGGENWSNSERSSQESSKSLA